MCAMLRIPSMGPENGGQGEKERAAFLKKVLEDWGFKEIEIIDAPDARVQTGVRPSVLAKIPGKNKRTVWIVSHIDTVSPGDLVAWSSPPFQPEVREGKIFGRGAEDNGQAVISSMFAAKTLLQLNQVPELGIGVALVADEEAGSDYGIKYLIAKGLFDLDDIFYVPDYGDENGSVVEVAEKSIIWLKVVVRGKQVHASTPEKGLNALTVGSELLSFLREFLYGKYSLQDAHLFNPAGSTFEPTKRLANVENINTVPGEDIFFFDIRLLPEYDTKECIDSVREVAKLFEQRSGAKIQVLVERIDVAGKSSPTDNAAAMVLCQAIKKVKGLSPRFVGIGGQTCSNSFRSTGLQSYVWQTVDEVAHQANEYCWIRNLVGDAQVFTALLAALCYPSQYSVDSMKLD